MAELKISPTPWQIKRGMIRDANRNRVVQIFGPTAEATDANTVFIAHAPEMFAALMAAREFIFQHHATNERRSAPGKVYTQIEAAMAAAKGE